MDAGPLLAVLGIGAALAWWWNHIEQTMEKPPRGRWWLWAAWGIPLLDWLRWQGVEIPVTWFEPLGFTAITALGVAALAKGETRRLPISENGWRTLVAAAGMIVAAYWFWQACDAYDRYLLGFYDWGHFVRRIVNTWEGRGFLLETPSLPAYWDHYNPGLALLAPLWGVCPDVRLFFALHAICLAAPGFLIYAAARRWGASPGESAAWAAAYWCFPSTGQLNLSDTYGWHLVTFALPAIWGAILAASAKRWMWAAALAALACSFKETVWVALGCFCFALAVQTWRDRKREPEQREWLSSRCSWKAWLAAWAVFCVGFTLVFSWAGFAEYQTSRFQHLGDSTFQILLSPCLRPQVFWREIATTADIYFVLALTIPLGWPLLRRGAGLLLAAALPLGVLLAWKHPPAVSVAYQYQTTLLPILFAAALAGAAVLRKRGERSPGVLALAGCLTASFFYGALPWSSPTLTIAIKTTYPGETPFAPSREAERGPGSPAHAALEKIIQQVGGPDSRVLASGRIAAHLLGVRRLEAIEQGVVRWPAIEKEAGEGKQAIEVFDWVVVDTLERFQQSADKIPFVIEEAQQANYSLVQDSHGILVFKKP